MRKLSTGMDRRQLLPTGLLILLAVPIGAMAQFTPAPGSPFAVLGPQPGGEVSGDFNGDGIQDLAIVNFNYGTSSSSLTVVLGDGSGGFTAAPGSPFALPAGSGAGFLAVGDFNGDGKLDLAIPCPYLRGVYVLLGNGSGGFTPASLTLSSTSSSPPEFAVVADFNGDGILDLVTGNTDDSLTLLLGNGSGGFTLASYITFAPGVYPQFPAIGDFNGDGKKDLAIPLSGTNNVAVFLGNGSGEFAPAAGGPFAVGSSPNSVAVGDFNGDGIQDLAVPNVVSNDVTVLLGNGFGGFKPAPGSPFAVGSGPNSVAVGDFNGDGFQDLAVSNSRDGGVGVTSYVTVLLGSGSGAFIPASYSPIAMPVGFEPVSILTADFNRDGKPDLAIVNASATNSFQYGLLTVLLGGPLSKATATVTLGSLAAAYDGTAKSATATTNPPNLTVTFTYNGSSTAPIAIGSYSVVGTINDPSYAGSAIGTLVISKAAATVTLGSLSATYDGTAKSATATTNPPNLTVTFTYNGSSTAPTAAGSYSVVGTINDPTYAGSATGTLVITTNAPTNLTAEAVSGSAINLTWTGNSTTATAILVENSTNNGTFTQIASLAGTATSYSNTALTSGNIYYYRVRAQFSTGTSLYSNTASVNFSVPGAPSNFTAGQSQTGDPTSQIRIAWQDNPPYGTGHAIFRSLDGVTFTQIPIVAANLYGIAGYFSYQDAGLAASTAYHYYVKATNIVGMSAASNTDWTVTAAAISGGGSLLPPSNLSAGQDLTSPASQINVFWQNNSSKSVQTSLRIFRSVDGGATFTLLTSVTYTTSYSDTGLSPNTAYYYYVEAVGPSGTTTASNTDWTITANVTTSGGAAPAAPGNFAAGESSVNPQTQINLYWQDNSNNEAGFQIFRSSDGGVTFAQLATVGPNVTSYQDTGLAAGAEYYYYVKAWNASGTSAASNTDRTFTADSTVTTGPAPPAPTNVAAGQSLVNPRTQINVYWQDNASNEAGFQIFRSLDGVAFTQVATIAPNVALYENTGVPATTVYYDQDATLAPNTKYYYYVKAFNTAGTSAASNTDSTITAP